MGAIFRKEMRTYFTSPVAYIYLAVFYLLTGIFFVTSNIYGKTTDMTYVFTGVFAIMMFFLPLLTMRLFTEEKRQKTEQCLLTAPVNLLEIVLGKFFAATVIFLIGMAIYAVYILILVGIAGSVAMSTILSTLAALLLLGASFISIGVFFSSVTENQIVAVIFSLVLNIVLYMIDIFASKVPFAPIQKAMISLGFYSRYSEFTTGILNITSIVFFLSVIAVFNFLTVRVLEKRRWS